MGCRNDIDMKKKGLPLGIGAANTMIGRH